MQRGTRMINRSFIREKVVHCGKNFLSPEIYPYSGQQQQAVGRKRGKKVNVSAPKQKNLNDRRAKRYFIQLANSNFGVGDLVVHLTYAPEFLPESEEEAAKIVAKYLRRVAYLRKKRGLPPLKYLLVTQIGRKKDGTHRIHHHILMNGGLDRDEVENLWWETKGTKEREPVMYGWANADRLRPNAKGIASMAGYMVQDSAGKKHWTQSQNLEKPWHRAPNDRKYTRRQLDKIAKLPQVERILDKGYEILYFTENVDEFAVRMMQNYQDKQFQSVLDSNLDLESEEEKKELEEKQESSKDMLEEMKKALEGKVGNVKLSGRLKSHPVCLSSEGELSMEMAKTLNAMPGTEGQKLQAQTVLEINPEHPIYQRLMELQTSDTAKLDEYAKLLYDQALLIAGMPVEDPVAFSNRICDLM